MANQIVQFYVESDSQRDISIVARLDDREIGRAECEVRRGRMKLCDIRVEDNVRYRRSFWLMRWLRGQTYTRSFRGQKVGKALWAHVLAAARRHGATEIWGAVVQRDIENTPYLLDWYRKRGFTILEADAECRDIGVPAVKKVVLRLEGTPVRQNQA